MKNIIIAANQSKLLSFLGKDTKGYLYILLDDSLDGLENFFEEKGYAREDIDKAGSRIDFRSEYINFIGGLNRKYNSVYWFANSISCKGTFVSTLHKRIYNYFCIIALIKNSNANYIIGSGDVVLNNSIKKYCEGNDIGCFLLGNQKKKGRLVHFRRCLLGGIRFVWDGWLRKLLTQVYLAKAVTKGLKSDKSYYVIKSWVEKRSFRADNSYADVFFGRLPDYLRGKEFIILAGILTDYRDMIRKLRGIKELLVVPQEYFVGYFDYMRVAFLALAKVPRIKAPIKFIDLDVTDLVKDSLGKDYEYGEIQKNLIYGRYIKGLTEKIKVNTFIYTFENQSWERISILALRRYSPMTKIIGYAHAAIPQSALSYFYSREEEDAIPFPDRVITIGMETKLLLSSEGRYSKKVDLSEGCALRYEHVFKKQKKERFKGKNILVAFSIHRHYSWRLLKFLHDSLKDKGGYNMILRAHPFSPMESMLERSGLSLNPNFIISTKSRLEEDLLNSSMLIYVDTTSSIEALMCGVPVIYVDLREPICTDPLFKLNSLKWSVSNGNDLCRVIDYILNMDDAEYLKKFNEAMAYLRQYLYPVEEKCLKQFVD